MIKYILTAVLLLSVTLYCCSNSDGTDDGLQPALVINDVLAGASTVSVGFTTVNATHVRIYCLTDAAGIIPTPEEVISNGNAFATSPAFVDGLGYETDYTLFAVACDDTGNYSALQTMHFTTDGSEAEPYPWESERSGLMSFANMVLCYGGSPHRHPYFWDAERLAPYVTYVDEDGTEHWLFDCFLFLEYTNTSSSVDSRHYSYCVGNYGISAGKAQWEEQIDFWFRDDNGFNGLEQAIENASKRLGTPASKHKVVMSIPDAIIYQTWDDVTSSTTYWGEVNGRKMDFSSTQDRITAIKWYINRIRARFDEGNYRHIDLAGFYCISEELVSPDDGWNYDKKKSDEFFPTVAAYLHSLNHCVTWIPYNRSAGYTRWERFGVDYAYMQPNYFWDEEGTRPLSRFFTDIDTYHLHMELEFDDKLLDGNENAEVYRKRLRDYMAGALQNIYGSKMLAYYQDNNSIYNLWASDSEIDRELYHEFCRFVINNPLRD